SGAFYLKIKFDIAIISNQFYINISKTLIIH
ncbi:unnamed protein product, partial [marine sediment metagenome]